MESIKKPETLLAGGALVTSVGTAVYFHKQIGSIREDMIKISDHLTAAIRKLNDNQTHSVFSTLRMLRQLASRD